MFYSEDIVAKHFVHFENGYCIPEKDSNSICIDFTFIKLLWNEEKAKMFSSSEKNTCPQEVWYFKSKYTVINDKTKKWAATWQNQQNECAPSEDSDQPGHPPSLIRLFAFRMKKHWAFSYPLSTQRRLIRLGGCLGWFESSLGAGSFCWFYHVVAQIFVETSALGPL